ncbi:MAG: FtsX-like permease family protein [Ruminococcus sp.]|nr:FtsX-like permease family protein [Ruminococcus sp.]
MKHLFRLALKYVTRQKLRTALMFVSVALSVFVLNTFLVYTSSALRTMRNNVADHTGEWEADLAGVLDAVRDGRSETVKSPTLAAKMISNHVAVDKSYIYIFDRYQFPSLSPDETSGLFRVELDNGAEKSFTSIFRDSLTGDIEMRNTFMTHTDDLAPDEIIAPRWFRQAGYSVGDTVTMTITPESGTLDESSEAMKAVRAELARLNEESDEFYYILEGEKVDQAARGDRRTVKRYLSAMLEQCGGINDLELSDREMSTPVKVTARIASFDNRLESDSGMSMLIMTALDTDVDFSALADSPLPFGRYSRGSCMIKTNPNTSFEYDMELLLGDLGFTDKDAYDDFKYEMHGYGIELNTPYLLTSLRSIDGIATAVPYIGAYLVVLVIVWFFARFIIDNAFEISVQERSVQFAALRVMGASKAQLAALVFTEGLFYALTALPLGVVTSTLACKLVFDSFRGIGFDTFEFCASPLTILICTLLCLLGIFISTYTSAMWAARKLTPAEALNYGKPKSRKKPLKKQKQSKLSLGSKRFMVRYTMKNILSTKRRFLISSVAMALGVLMFTLCVQFGISLYGEVKQQLGEPVSDFYIYADAANVADIQRELADSGNFRSAYYDCHGSILLTEAELKKLGDAKEAVLENNRAGDGSPINLIAMDKNEFEDGTKGLGDIDIAYEQRDETSYAELFGMSYEEFEQGGAVLSIAQKRNDGTNYGYGYTPLSEPVTLVGAQGEEIELRGIVNVGYGSNILLPMSMAQELINDGKSMNANLHLVVRDKEHYPAAKEAVNSVKPLCIDVYDEYKSGTGFMELVSTVVTVVLIFMLSIWLCGIVSMMNTINTSALNRSRELLMMRAVGMTRRQLTGTVVLESLLFSAVSAIAGTLVSIAAYLLIMRFMLGISGAAVSFAALVISALVNIVIAFAAALPAIRTLNHLVTK